MKKKIFRKMKNVMTANLEWFISAIFTAKFRPISDNQDSPPRVILNTSFVSLSTTWFCQLSFSGNLRATARLTSAPGCPPAGTALSCQAIA